MLLFDFLSLQEADKCLIPLAFSTHGAYELRQSKEHKIISAAKLRDIVFSSDHFASRELRTGHWSSVPSLEFTISKARPHILPFFGAAS